MPIKGNSEIATRYAKALFELAKDNGLEAVEKDMDALAEVLKSNKDVQILVQSPLISRVQKEKALDAVLAASGSQDLTRKFIATLAKNNRLSALSQIIAAFGHQIMAYRNEITAEIISAVPLDSAKVSAVQEALAASLGKKVKTTLLVDKSILGGLVIKVGSLMLDDSLKSKLERLAQLGNDADKALAA